MLNGVIMTKDEYIEIVLSHISSKKENNAIRQELLDHIDDRIEYYTDAGYDLDYAEKMALTKMGNPEELGDEMNKVHKPVNKKPIRIILIIIAVLIIFKLITLPFFGDYTLYGKYFLNKNELLCTVDLSKLGDYEDYKYQIHHENMAIFTSDASVLTAEYAIEKYQNQLEYIKDNYTFLNEPVKDVYDNGNVNYLIPENEFDIGKWHFRVVSYSEEYEDYPHHIEMIAQNDDVCKIAYLDFYDSDLDCIGEDGSEGSMENFIKEYFNYNFNK